MEILKTILYWIWKIVSYTFQLIWNIIAFVFGWIWDYIKLDFNTPTTASGKRDRRFKSTRELDKKDSRIGCIITIILILVVGIDEMGSNKKSKDVNTKHTDPTIVENNKTDGITKPRSKPNIHQNEKIVDTTILPETSVYEDEIMGDSEIVKYSEIVELDIIVDSISFDSINI